MNITTEQLKALREETGVSVMQCKKALEEAGGDMEKAVLILKKKSSDIAAKKADREAHDGVVIAKKDGTRVAVVMLNCETDFVAKNSDFVELAQKLVDLALKDGKDAVMAQAQALIDPVVQKVGENIQLGSVDIIEGAQTGVYVHDNKIATVISLEGGNDEVAKDMAMHMAAMRPEYISREDIPADMQSKVKEMFAEEVAQSDKPADIKEKMLQGKIDTFFKERTLLDQPFVKNPDMTTKAYMASAGAKVTSMFIKSL